MIHLVYDSDIYLNIDTARVIRVDTNKNKLVIMYTQDDSKAVDITTHPKVKELLAKYEANKDEMTKYILFKVLEIILERLSKTDEKLSPIINLESVLNTLHTTSEDSLDEQAEKEIIPVTTDADGNITKVLKEDTNE